MKRKDLIAILICLGAFTATVSGVYWFKTTSPSIVALHLGSDWTISFKPAAELLLKGGNIFSAEGYFNPPWTLFILMPFFNLPNPVAVSFIFTINLFIYFWVALKLQINKFLLLPFIVFGGVLWNSYIGNIDGLVALGLILNRPLGLLFLAMKPQVGAPIGLLWLIDEWLQGGWKKALRTFLPLALAGALMFLFFGEWIIKANQAISNEWNTSPWPYGIPLGVLFLGFAVKQREIRWALVSVPFLTPYLTGHTWSFMWLGLLTLDWKQIRANMSTFFQRRSSAPIIDL